MATATRERPLPHAADAEAQVVGSILMDGEALASTLTMLSQADFYIEKHRLIYSAVCDLVATGAPVNLVSVTEILARHGRLDDAGGSYALSMLCDRVVTTANVEYNAKLVEQASTRRRMIDAAMHIVELAYDEEDTDEAIAQAGIAMADATLPHNGANDSIAASDAIDAFLAKVADDYESGVQPGLMTGIRRLDYHTLGFMPGELIYVCGRPGSGKSAIAAEIALCAARDAATNDTGGAVEWISLEMSHIQQVKRLITSWSGIDGRMIRSGFVNPDGSKNADAYADVVAHAGRLRQKVANHLRFYDRALTIEQLATYLTRAVFKRGCPLAVVDYIGLLEMEDARANDYQRITKISRRLKQLALELNIPILCLVQLNRECEKRADKRPILSDLRESGGLEQDADFVVGVYRGAYYQPGLAELDHTFAQLAELIVLKAREGVANVTIPARFEAAYTRVGNWPEDWAYLPYLQMKAGDATSHTTHDGEESD